MRITLKQKIKQLAKEEGLKSITEFLNAWIESGETFTSLQERLLLEEDFEVGKTWLWKVLRSYLTVPYDYDDQFWYKWNSIAKSKGYKNPKSMIETYQSRFCNAEIAEELGVGIKTAPTLIKRLLQDRVDGKPIKRRKYKSRIPKNPSMDRNGIVRKDSREEWNEKLKKYGFRSLRDAIWRMKKRKMSYVEMARALDVKIRVLRSRRRKAGL